MFNSFATAVFVVACLLLSSCGAPSHAVTIFAASSLHDVLGSFGRDYQSRFDQPVQFSFASSSLLARQIAAGAPADIVVTASEEWMDWLAARDLLESGTRVAHVGNELVLIAPAHSTADGDAGAVLTALAPNQRLAIGDPAHVPAGIYAREALTALELWQPLQGRLAPADNARAALALVARGEAALGIVYATDLKLAPQVKRVAGFAPHSHTPIRYSMALLRSAPSPHAAAVFAQLSGDMGRAHFVAAGFEIH